MVTDSTIITKVFDNSIRKDELLNWKDERGHNVWHLLSSGKNDDAFFNICKKVTKSELQQKLNEKNELGDTPIHIAAWSNATKVIDYLLNQENIDFNQYLDNQGRTIVFIATEMNHTDIIDLCFEKGVNLDLLNNKGKTLEYYALSYDNQNCLEHIKKVKNVDENNNYVVDNGGEILNFFEQNKKLLAGRKQF